MLKRLLQMSERKRDQAILMHITATPAVAGAISTDAGRHWSGRRWRSNACQNMVCDFSRNHDEILTIHLQTYGAAIYGQPFIPRAKTLNQNHEQISH